MNERKFNHNFFFVYMHENLLFNVLISLLHILIIELAQLLNSFSHSRRPISWGLFYHRYYYSAVVPKKSTEVEPKLEVLVLIIANKNANISLCCLPHDNDQYSFERSNFVKFIKMLSDHIMTFECAASCVLTGDYAKFETRFLPFHLTAASL